MYKLLEHIYLIIYIVVNVGAIVILVAAFRSPKLARILLSAIFLWGCWAILKMAYSSPRDILSFEAPTIKLYRNLFTGWFSQHIQLVAVVVGFLHGFVAFSLLLKGHIYRIGLIMGAIFLIIISPFGQGAAFPCPLILAVAMIVLLRYKTRFIWEPGAIPGLIKPGAHLLRPTSNTY
ncbi:MAG: hypothetical protein ABI151_04090 [Chitinophagaceae bacterium]